MDYIGQIVNDKYEIIRLLGEGGMGAVYLGRHTLINRKVAVKILHGKYQRDEKMVRRFYREAQAAAAIEHKNIIDVIDVGVAGDGSPYLVMEYLEGESLSDLLHRKGPLELAAACGILDPVLKALGAAHKLGIYHRDLKPENIFIVQHPDETPIIKLIDFGISKFQNDAAGLKLTQTGAIMGTPLYMAPEQLLYSKSVDARTDLYAVGVILYEMLTGRLPFIGENYSQLMAILVTEDPPPPTTIHPDFPAEAESLVMKAIDKNQADRFQTAEAFLDALQALTGFEERDSRLSRYTNSITKKRIASGDLGETDEKASDEVEASKVIAEMVSRTPSAWSTSVMSTERTNRRGLWIGLASGVAVLIAFGIGWRFLQPSSAPATHPSPPVHPPADIVPALSQQESAVEIRLIGVPKGATVTYDGMRVDINPFPVEKANIIKKLRVEAKGFETWTKGVLPSKDQEIRVSLVPLSVSPATDELTPLSASASNSDGETAKKHEEKKEQSTHAKEKKKKKETDKPKPDKHSTKVEKLIDDF